MGEVGSSLPRVRGGLHRPRRGHRLGSGASVLGLSGPIQNLPLPAVTDSRWVASPIDTFVLSRLEAKGLKPAPPADSGAGSAGSPSV